MATSQTHQALVDEIVDWLRKEHGINKLRLTVDDTGPVGASKPKAIYGHVPDVYGKLTGSNYTIIGEAKTPRDLESPHTWSQLESFIRHLSVEGGGELILATQWSSASSAKAIVRRLCQTIKPTGVRAVVLDQLSV